MTEDLQRWHHNFSAAAHNEAMEIFYANEATWHELQSLIELAHVAHCHWMQRTDREPKNESVALWVLSRAYSANGYGDQALRYAKLSLTTIENENLLPSFYGYSNEALARAYALQGDGDLAKLHLDRAFEIAKIVPNAQAKEYLLDQINRIKLGGV